MPKKAAGRKKSRGARRPLRVKLFAAGLALSLAAAAAAVALRRPERPSGSLPAPVAAPAPLAAQGNFSPSSPAKEYVYAGGRLVATVEPTPAPTPTPFPPCAPPVGLIISEFRFRGPAGPADEYVEFYNSTDSPITVCTADGSAGWALAARDSAGASAATLFVIPYGTLIPARAHLLAVNGGPGGYSLSAHPAAGGTTATGDITYTAGVEDNSGVALFKTANPANFNTANRLDAAGFAGPAGAAADLYREGAGLAQVGTANGEYAFVRAVPNGVGLPQDTGNNAADFLFVSTTGGSFGGAVQSKLGAPGPENLSSPVRRNASMPILSLDATVAASQPPNRVRDLTSDPWNNATFGTLSFRRRVVNNTGQAVTRLRFRITGITTFPAPAGVADLRVLSSSNISLTGVNDANTCAALGTPATPPCSVAVRGTAVEGPPSQPNGGGDNTALTVALPQPLAPGASVGVQWLMGVQQSGSFHLFVNVEALP